jgi:glycosyltransferase involved in cell wall biosynthesis
MNILEVTEAASAGVGRHVRSLSEGLIKQGHRLTVAYSPYRLDEAFKGFLADLQDEIRFVPLEITRAISPASDLRGVLKLVRLIRREGPFDIVHGHSSKGGAVARIAGRFSGVSTVYTSHSLILSSPEISQVQAIIYASIERLLGRLATSKIIAVSEDEREFIKQLGLVSEDCIAMVRNAIDDLDFEYFAKEPRREDNDKKPITFGSTMRFSRQKAPGRLIQAFAQFVEMSPKVPSRLVVAGDGELFAEAKRQVKANGLDDRMSLVGWRADVKGMLRNLDIFVVSSLYESGLSYSTMEAMAAKLPVISTNVFGTKETVGRVPGNILVPVGDVEALAQGMKKMTVPTIHGPVRRSLQRIGQANHDYVSAHFRQSKATERHLEIYQALLREQRKIHEPHH